jgi:hypothetical protein
MQVAAPFAYPSLWGIWRTDYNRYCIHPHIYHLYRETTMTLLNEAKNKIRTQSSSNVFKNEDGAIDLASIMVGIIVIGLIGGVIAATVFAVIPWAQNNAAKQQLDAVVSAQSAAAGTNGGLYTTNLSGWLDTKAANVTVQASGSKCYAAFTQSATGKVYYVSSKKTAPSAITGNSWPSAAPTDYPTDCIWPSSLAAATHPNLFTNSDFSNSIAGINYNNQVSVTTAESNPIGNGPALKVSRVAENPSRSAFMADLQNGKSYTLIFTIAAEKDETITVNLRGTIDVADQAQLGIMTLKAGEKKTVSYTGTLNSPSGTSPGFALIDSAGSIGDTYYLDDVSIVEN